MPEFYQDILAQTEKELAANVAKGSAETPDTQQEKVEEPTQTQAEEPKIEISPEEKAFLDKLAANNKDIETRFAYAKWLFETAQRNDDAVEECLTIMSLDKKWNDRAAYNLLIEIFNKMGAKNEKVIAARKRLSKLLF